MSSVQEWEHQLCSMVLALRHDQLTSCLSRGRKLPFLSRPMLSLKSGVVNERARVVRPYDTARLALNLERSLPWLVNVLFRHVLESWKPLANIGTTGIGLLPKGYRE